MEKEKIVLNIFSVNDKDTIRIEEQFHESRLKKQLLDFGIIMNFDTIPQYGIRNISGV